MTEQNYPNDKGVRILLEALTTISYQKGGDGRAAAIADYALDKYGRTMKEASAADRRPSEYGAPEDIVEHGSELQSIPGHHQEQRNQHARRRSDRLSVNSDVLAGQAERRRNGDRRVNPDRRRNP